MPRTLLRATNRVVTRDEERARVTRQLEEAQYGRGHLLLRVDQVAPNPRNPRQVFSEDAINELAQSILSWGQLQPIVVRPMDGRYEIICGERRWRAHQRAGLEKIWAVERSASDADSYKLALIENLHRVDLSHAEKVAALDQLAELAAVAGLRRTAAEIKVSPGWLSTQLSLRQDPVIFPSLEAGQIGFAQATELRRAPAHARRALLDRTLREKPAFRTIREWTTEIRHLERQARAGIGAHVAGNRSTTETSSSPYGDVLARLRALGAPSTAVERGQVREIVQLCRAWLGDDEPAIPSHSTPSTPAAQDGAPRSPGRGGRGAR